MKANSICDGCGEEFNGVGIYCSICAPHIKLERSTKKPPKFGRDPDTKRNRIKYRAKGAQQNVT